MLKTYFILLSSFVSFFGHAQSWVVLQNGTTNPFNSNLSINYRYALTTDPSGNVYTTLPTSNINPSYNVTKWNGSTWSTLGSLNGNGEIDVLYSDKNGNIYAGGQFVNSQNYTYVAKWNGSSWTEIKGVSTTTSLNGNGGIQTICSDPLGNLYAAGAFKNSYGKTYVAKWNGNTWAELGTSTTTALNGTYGINSICSDPSGNIYAVGNFTDANNRYYLAKWDGTSWSVVGQGLPFYDVNGPGYSVVSDRNGNIYVAGGFTNNGYYVVAKWDGSSFSYVGGDNSVQSNAGINAIAVDSLGNLYATFQSTYSSSINTIAYWDGSSWSQLGGTAGYNAPRILSIDKKGNVYTSLNNSSTNYHYAIGTIKSPSAITGINEQSKAEPLIFFPNPSKGKITVNAQETGQLSLYNSAGILVSTFHVVSGSNEIQLSQDLQFGLYTLGLKGQTSTYYQAKLIKE